MVFSSLSFLVVFLPVLAILYFIIPAKWKHARQYLLLAFSLLFYGSGEPLYIFLIIACISLTWVLSKYVATRRKWALVLSIMINIIPLIVTKYAGFVLENVGFIFRITDMKIPSIVMPIGISFYTFQVITYIVDLYGKKVERQRNPLLFSLYIMFFPQLIAGPIVKYSEVQNELEHPDVNWNNVKYGAGRFIMGLGKKVLIANQAGYIASSIKGSSLSSLTTPMTWLCVLAYSIQFYFDFSGYSEMASGLGSMFGFHVPENFLDPYTSTSISDFWRKWHVTLGRFFREYVYIPLGGNRVSKPRWVLNILIVWSLTGLWHGASWNFVIWGLYYGILIIIEKALGISKKLPKAITWIFTMFFVAFGWGIFMCDSGSFNEMLEFLGKLLFINKDVVSPVTVGSLKLWGYIPFLILGVIVSTPLWVFIRKRAKVFRMGSTIIGDVYLVAVLVVSLVFLLGGTYNPFIYFRF